MVKSELILTAPTKNWGQYISVGNGSNIDNAQFRAFVSYSHADAAIAKKLHRKMEAYKLPKLLREMQSGGKKDGRLGQLFRDREDLPAALDLSESVKAALAQSEALIVICSPNAKNSPWVAKEIELFRELHPDRQILAALISGEPGESFPPALTEEGEPLAADLRKEGDGWRLGLLKLIAGVADVPLDALVQRDAQRQFRSVMAVTLATTIGLLTMIGMTVYAIQQRNEAQHQQAQAEGLVEYMLTDLREELKGVGRLDVMTDVNERAMDYYKAQGGLNDRSAESLERRARILHAMGEDDEKRGDLDKALEKFMKAHRVTDALLARDLDNPDRIFGHAQSEYWVGFVAYRKKDWSLTNQYWQNYKEHADRLIKLNSHNRIWLKESAYAHGNLCTLALRRKSSNSDSLDSCLQALETMQKVWLLSPSDHATMEDVANRHAWLADAYVSAEDFEKALIHRKHQEELILNLLQLQSDNNHYIELLLRNKISLFQLFDRMNLENDAIDYATEARTLASRLALNDPENHIWSSYQKTIEQYLVKSKGEHDGSSF